MTTTRNRLIGGVFQGPNRRIGLLQGKAVPNLHMGELKIAFWERWKADRTGSCWCGLGIV
jgi:hypothetical protein